MNSRSRRKPDYNKGYLIIARKSKDKPTWVVLMYGALSYTFSKISNNMLIAEGKVRTFL
jgi:hypothetical protein